MALAGAALLAYSLRKPFATEDAAWQKPIDSIVYQGHYYIVALAAGAALAGVAALALGRRSGMGPAVLAGFALAGLWGTAVFQVLGIRVNANPHSFSGYHFEVSAGYVLALAGHYAIVLAGSCAVLALWMRGRGGLGVRAPRDKLSITTLLLGLSGCAAVSFAPFEISGWAFLRGDFVWITVSAAALAAVPVAAACLRPRVPVCAAMIGLAIAAPAIRFQLYSLGQHLDKWGGAIVYESGNTDLTGWLLVSLGAVGVINLIALVKIARRQRESAE
ncbi:hypothetical protein JMUB6875_76970 [Nocardia sp. JMUB6875]|uniref:hypothetical protein n=1 Tax=Nocardia sp. JMUB6875 TaxID=3158170 RepID=UPI0032E7E582